MTITKSDTAPATPDLLLAFDTDATGSQSFFTMARGGGSSGVGGGETAFGQTFRFGTGVLLDKITFKVRITQDVSHVPLLLWFGTGYSGTTNSGMSSLIIEPEADLPAGMGGDGSVWYLTLDIEDQLLVPQQTYAFMPRFASGGSDGTHPEMQVGFMGGYTYADGAAFTFDGGFGYNTILNNEMVFFLQGEVVPEPLLGDLDEDGFVGITDLNIVLGAWNQTIPPGNLLADPSGDGFVGIEDLNVVLGNWNAGTPPVNNANIPEPGTLGILGILGLLALRSRRIIRHACPATR